VGIAGGEANKSYYFSGIINAHLDPDPYLIYLDPHFVHETFKELSAPCLNTYFCSEVRTLRLSKICAGVALGFYVKDLEDFYDFKR
jgi:hypothetical protein